MLLASEDIKQKQNERTNRQRPFPPVSLQAGCLFAAAAGVHAFISKQLFFYGYFSIVSY